MARTMRTDADASYRVVVERRNRAGHVSTEIYGPWGTLGAARGQATMHANRGGYYNSDAITARVQRTSTEWVDVPAENKETK